MNAEVITKYLTPFLPESRHLRGCQMMLSHLPPTVFVSFPSCLKPKRREGVSKMRRKNRKKKDFSKIGISCNARLKIAKGISRNKLYPQESNKERKEKRSKI